MIFVSANRFRTCCVAGLLAVFLSSCSYIPSWLGGSDSDDDKPKLAGKRIDVLSDVSQLRVDEALNDVPVTLPDVKANENWRQASGAPQGLTGNLQISSLKKDNRTHIGDGNKWEQPLYTQPIVAENVVFAMDSKGYVTAHDATDIEKVIWTNKSAVTKHEPDILGGGLGYDNGHVYVTTGRGNVYALDSKTGKEIWRQFIGIPLRAAPKAGDGRVYLVSVDNQLFTLDANSGKQLWNHRGINENAGFLSSVSPTISQTVVIAPYSSGEIHALDSASGQEIWGDSLIRPRRNIATFGFSGIGGDPIIVDDTVYVAGSGGLFAAFSLQTGRRMWQQEISSLNTPWIAGDFIYMISTESQVVCMYRADGRIKWIKQLQRFEDEKKKLDPYVWLGPVMAGGQLYIADTHGEMILLNPKDGSASGKMDIPDQVTGPPVIASGRMYFITPDARLHVLY